VAGHDINAWKDGLVPEKKQVMLEMRVAIGLPAGTYGRLGARSGMDSRMGVAVWGGVIGANYTGEVKVILQNHGQADCLFTGGDRIAQLIVEKIPDAAAMEVDHLLKTERGKMGFGSSDLHPKRSITAKEAGVQICFLHTHASDNEFFSRTYISYDPWLMNEKQMVSSAHVNPALRRTMNDLFLDKIRVDGKEEAKWQERGCELVRLRE